MKLSRLSIVGDINENTPVCVLMEIADAHGVSYNIEDHSKSRFLHHLVTGILETSLPQVEENYMDLAQLQHMARFVNKNVIWIYSKLIKAYNYLKSFNSEIDPLSKIPCEFMIGLQTPEYPLSVNACILYKICTYYNINVNRSTTLQQMGFAVEMLRENISSISRRVTFFIENSADKIALINTLILSTNRISDPDPLIISNKVDYTVYQDPSLIINYDLLSGVCNSLNNVVILRSRFDPVTEAGAISLAALNFFLDISKSNYPITEYSNLRKTKNLGNIFLPVDPWLKYWYAKNPGMFNLTLIFNPLFCESFYEDSMITMVTNEGYRSREILQEDIYELLQLAYVSKTFYQGEMPCIKFNQTPILLEDLDKVPYGELLCYGQIGQPMDIISISEIIDLFANNKNFSTPFLGSTVFTSININKLKIIARSKYGCDPNREISQQTALLRLKLLDVISSVEILIYDTDKSVKRFIATYNNATQEIKENIVIILKNLLHLGLYMRGWSGESDNYPIAKSNGSVTSDEEKAVKVTDAVNNYERSYKMLDKIGTQINNLPLVLYKDCEYQISTDRSEGFTIGDRINLIKQGENTRNITSCIRLSSNWLCSSAHKYMLAINLPSPFEIHRLIHIS